MGDYYVDDMLEIFSGSGCMFGLNQINQGWERRSRSSGGFDAAPIGIQWHHTASKASVESDLNYMINGSPDRPVGNVLLDRNGIFWPVAAGAANTSGKGGPNSFSRGVCPLDKGNTKLFSIEIANNGVGEPYSAEQIDAAFCGSNALNANFGNQPDDVVTHALGEGDGYTSRKIDPATTNVLGMWEPRSVNSSGTWSLADLKAECLNRAGTVPSPPLPGPSSEEIDMLALDLGEPGVDPWWTRMTYTGDSICHVRSPFDQVQERGKVTTVSVSEEELSAMLKTVTTVGDSPFGPGQAPNSELNRLWEEARGRT